MTIAPPRTSVHPEGFFQVGIHRPSYQVINLRQTTPEPAILGTDSTGSPVTNEVNFPSGIVNVENADVVIEIPNPFPFWGTTYILDASAERCAEKHSRFSFNPFTEDKRTEDPSGFIASLMAGKLKDEDDRIISVDDLPDVLKLALAQNSRDPELLCELARLSCDFEYKDKGKEPAGILYRQCDDGVMRPSVRNFSLFKTVSNNPALPDSYKLAMVLMPGIQGTSPVVGEYGLPGEHTHIFEYLRANSYIPYGHFAANMAHDAVRYSASAVDAADMRGLRALYYQRIYVNMALALGCISASSAEKMRPLVHDSSKLEQLRKQVMDEIAACIERGEPLPYTSTLWGWNYGYDFSPSGYRLHASHQMVHQQFALIPPEVPVFGSDGSSETIPAYAIGDQVADFISRYHAAHDTSFFEAYISAIKTNRRIDGREGLPASLILYEDDNVILHAPKAQRSQGEVQIMAKRDIGNILEADSAMRASLDDAVLRAVKTLAVGMGAEMITCYEVSKRFDAGETGQRLIYCFLPRHSRSPGAFSERQGRWITGHYPEDYAHCFRDEMERLFR